MNNPLSYDPDQPFMLDNSGLQCFAQCERKHKLQNILHRASLDERIATALGSAVHDVAHAHFLGDSAKASEVFSLHSQRFVDGIFDLDERQETIAKFASATEQLMAHYPVQAAPGGLNKVLDLQLNTRWIVRYPERSFIQPLASPSNGAAFVITGRIDCIIEDANKQMWILELKTSRKATNSVWRDSWKMSTQPLTYTFVASQQLGKLVAGVIIIPIQINKRDAVVTPEIIIRPSAKALAEWWQVTLTLMHKIKQAKQSNTFLPTGMYAGNCSNEHLGKCTFFDYCRLGQPLGWLEDNTKEHIWNPLAQATPAGVQK